MIILLVRFSLVTVIVHSLTEVSRGSGYYENVQNLATDKKLARVEPSHKECS